METREKLNELTTEALGNYYSDFGKEINGFRPRDVAMDNREGLIDGILGLRAYMDAMSQTKDGRNQLRCQGWVINEPATAEQDGFIDPYQAMREEEAREIEWQQLNATIEASYTYPGVNYEYLEQ